MLDVSALESHPSQVCTVAHLGREILRAVISRFSGNDDKIEWQREFSQLRDIVGPILNQSIPEPRVSASANEISDFSVPIVTVRQTQEWFERNEPRLQKFAHKIQRAYSIAFRTPGGDDSTIAPSKYIAVYKEFQSKAHYNPQYSPWTSDEMLHWISSLEIVLLPFAMSFVQTMTEIDEILQEANS